MFNSGLILMFSSFSIFYIDIYVGSDVYIQFVSLLYPQEHNILRLVRLNKHRLWGKHCNLCQDQELFILFQLIGWDLNYNSNSMLLRIKRITQNPSAVEKK